MGPSALLSPLSTVQSLYPVATSSKPISEKKLLAGNNNNNGTRVLPLSDAPWKGGLLISRAPTCLFSFNWTLARPSSHMYFTTWRTFAAAVQVEEAAPSELGPEDVNPDDQSNTVKLTEEEEVAAPVESKLKPGQVRRRGKVTVDKSEIVPGAVFKGKVVSIMAFGAFVDFGAFTNGLVHISRLSNGYVRAVEDVVTTGQEVEVVVVDTKFDLNRISLKMKEEKAVEAEMASAPPPPKVVRSVNIQQKKADSSLAPAKRRLKTTKLKAEQSLDGVVKNFGRRGVFISLPEGEEGFLDGSQVRSGVAMVAVENEFQIGQEVKVRVLKVEKGRVFLTMKQKMDIKELNRALNKDVEGATNPFVLAFQQSESISSFLAERVEAQKAAAGVEISTTQEVVKDNVAPEVEESKPAAVDQESSAVSAVTENESISAESQVVVEIPSEVVKDNVAPEMEESEPATVDQESSVVSAVTENEPISAESQEVVEIPSEVGEDSNAKNEIEEEESSPTVDGSTAFLSSQNDEALSSQNDEAVAPVEESEDTSALSSFADQESQTELSASEEIKKDTIPHAVSEAPEAKLQADKTEEQVSEVAKLEDALPSEAEVTKAVTSEAQSKDNAVTPIAAALVKVLREETGAGLMDCKKALTEASGDLDKAREILRKKGLAGAEKKAGRIASEGRIGSYIHDNRIGVLIEVNCETDFVARGDIFKNLVDDLAMQVAACAQVRFVSVDDVPPEAVEKERAIEMGREDLLKKPEQIREKIVEGRISKRLAELALLEQAFVRDDSVLVKDHVKQMVATLGENIQVRRFLRFNLGEGLEKKSGDFAAEVAEMAKVKDPVS